jgi:hypothetical protein
MHVCEIREHRIHDRDRIKVASSLTSHWRSKVAPRKSIIETAFRKAPNLTPRPAPPLTKFSDASRKANKENEKNTPEAVLLIRNASCKPYPAGRRHRRRPPPPPPRRVLRGRPDASPGPWFRTGPRPDGRWWRSRPPPWSASWSATFFRSQ